MPKRKRDKYEDSEFNYYLSKKLKKLQRKIRRGRRRSDTSSSSDSDNFLPRNRQERNTVTFADESEKLPGCSYWSDVHCSDMPETVEDSEEEAQPTALPPLEDTVVTTEITPTAANTAATDLLPDAADRPPTTADLLSSTTPLPTTAAPLEPTLPLEGAAQVLLAQAEIELDPELMEILGKDPASVKIYGNDIQKDLAIRLNHLVTAGLSKEVRKELKEKYLVPENCKLLKAPCLNPEIKASLIESQAKRDKGIENKQEMISCALSSLSTAITQIISSENKQPELLKLLMDTARTLADVQHAESTLRRVFILSTVKKDLKEQLEKTKIDEMLFGSNLSETLKSAKTISKSGADIRAISTVKSSVQRPAKPTNKPLNYRPPPAPRKPPPGGARGARATHPAPTPRQTTAPTMQHGGNRPSTRQPQTRYRR